MKPAPERAGARRNGIASIGDRVLPGRYIFHSRFKNAVNFSAGERLVSVVNEEVGPGPVNIVLRVFKPERIGRLGIDQENITIEEEIFPRNRAEVFNSGIDPGDGDRKKLKKNLAVFGEALKILSPDRSLAFLLDPGRDKNFVTSFEKNFLKRVKEAVETIFSNHGPGRKSVFNLEADCLSGIKKLKGLGFGLTPSGDDFIAGLLAALNLLETVRGESLGDLKGKIGQAAQGDNLLVNSFLSLAQAGFCFQRLRRLIFSLFEGNPGRVFEKTKDLIAHGETSGSDLGVGLFLTLKSGLTEEANSPGKFS